MPPTIYFSGSISGGRADAEHYRRIVGLLEARGFNVLAGAVTSQIGNGGEPLEARHIFERDLAWVAQSDVVVAEVSMPSTGVGYEIAAARYRYRIPVICLYRPAYTARCTAMVAGDDGVELIEYTDETFDAMLETLVNKLTAAPVS
jgi:nucleoside 2-deoxyribosyltransferase